MPESIHPPETSTPTHALGGGVPTLGLAALGVVFGDIGTSPLYTLHECTMPEHGAAPTPENILGVLSLIFWSLTMVVTQHRGTKTVGRLFGPVIVCWFFTIDGLGAYHLANNLAALVALSPIHAAHLFAPHRARGVLLLGSVVLRGDWGRSAASWTFQTRHRASIVAFGANH